MVRPEPSGRREFLVVLILTFLGSGLRFWSFDALGLTHFDEGIYAMSGLWARTPGRLGALNPSIIPYAPPGFPILVGLSYLLLGVSDASAIFVAAVCGTLTIPVVAWLGRRTFGLGAGAASAALATFSMAHVAFSRKALTDVPFVLIWVLALALGARFLERPRWGRAFVLGLAIGLAQLFKYNGWLLGIVVATAGALGVFVPGPGRRPSELARVFGLGVISALVAALAYLPWFRFVEAHDGYAALLRHHLKYTGGAAAWFPHWTQQAAQVVALSGGPAWCGLTWAVACTASGFVGRFATPRGRVPRPQRWRVSLLMLGGILAYGGLANLPWWIGVAALPWLLIDGRPGVRILGTCWVALTILTPFYHPYARLWLPLHATGWLLVGGLISEIERGALASSDSPRSVRTGTRVLAIAIAIVLASIQVRVSNPRAIAVGEFFRPTSALLHGVSALQSVPELSYGRRGGLRVLGRRPLAFYLVLGGRIPFQLEANLPLLLESSLAGELALVDEVQLRQETGRDDPWESLSAWTPVFGWEEWLDPITLLDVNPDAAFRKTSNPGQPVAIRLLRRAVQADPPRPTRTPPGPRRNP